MFQDFLRAERPSPVCSYSGSVARKESEERKESWDPSMGECLYLRKPVTEDEIFFLFRSLENDLPD